MAAWRSFEGSYRGMSGWPLGKLADLRVRQGRFDEARRLTEGYESHPAARRVMAAVALGRGEVALAEELLSLCLDGEAAADPGCAPLLEMLVQTRIAREDIPAANEALERLVKVAETSPDDAAASFAELAAGRVRAAERDRQRSGPSPGGATRIHGVAAAARGSARAARAGKGAGPGQARSRRG